MLRTLAISLAFLVIFSCSVLLFAALFVAGKRINYGLVYRSQVEQTVRAMVRKEALR